MTTMTNAVTSDAGGYPRKRARTRRQLLNAGMLVLADKGPDGATVGAIARTAKVATGTFYNHFDSIDDLVLAITTELTAAVQIGRDTLVAIANDPAVRVLLGTEQLLDLAEADPDSAMAFVSLLASVPDFRARVRTIIGDTIVDGIDSGRFVNRRPGVVADALLGSVVQWMRSTLHDEDGDGLGRVDQLATVLSLVGVTDDVEGVLELVAQHRRSPPA